MQTASYGTWNSPITAEKIIEGMRTYANMLVDGTSTYWAEMRPQNKGRSTIVCRDAAGKIQDITPPDFSARTFVHEYGGGAFTVSNGVVYASNGNDHAIYVIKPGSLPMKLTAGQQRISQDGAPKWQGTRFADPLMTPHGLIAIGEQHEPGKTVENFLALIDTVTGEHKKLAAGHDFYSSPAISPDGQKLAWLCWNHPNMPWMETELWVADIIPSEGLKNSERIAGTMEESLYQPQWSPEGILYFVSDRSQGWWNLHRLLDGRIENVCPIEAEVGEPLWVFGRSSYAFLGSKIAFSYNSKGIWQLGLLDPHTKKWQKLPRDGNAIQFVRAGKTPEGKAFVQFLESYATKCEAIIQIDDAPGYPSRVLYEEKVPVDAGYISTPQHIEFPSAGRIAYGFYYPPKNKDFKAPPGEKPPLVVTIHGGPTSQARGSLQLRIQYWTSRGFALLDVNYGGSTGYGRAYRSLLDLNWGIVDVEDCVNGAQFLVQQGAVDPDKLVIRGGSAGGYTTLAALAFKDVFKAGASYYGVADISALAHDTHKFESRYMEQLVGKYPEEKDVWKARSPIHSIDQINSPLILFQGEDDLIVPKNQSIMIYEALKARGIPTELHVYAGEEHGFRQAQNIIHSLNREAEFYLEAFGRNIVS